MTPKNVTKIRSAEITPKNVTKVGSTAAELSP
jgi:hypothetical protein